MSEQQERGDEPGLVSTQELEPSKEEDGHVRQASPTNTHIHTLHLQPVMGSSPRRVVLSAPLCWFYFSCETAEMQELGTLPPPQIILFSPLLRPPMGGVRFLIWDPI